MSGSQDGATDSGFTLQPPSLQQREARSEEASHMAATCESVCAHKTEFEHTRECECARGTHGFYLQLMQEHMSPCQLDYSAHFKK